MMNGASIDELATDIANTILDGPFLDKNSLQPRIKALLIAYADKKIKGMSKQDLRQANHMAKDFEKTYWQRIAKQLCPDTIHEKYEELQALLIDHGFVFTPKKKKST